MPRGPRQLERNVVYHVYNRRNEKQCLFDSEEAYRDFVTLLRRAKEKHPIRLHAYCLMTTHWHLALSAEVPSLISRYMARVAGGHATQFRRQSATTGLGHVYQDRYCAVAAEGIVHYVRLIRYIESNPIQAGLVTAAQAWPWSSLQDRLDGIPTLDPGPWKLPSDWLSVVNTPEIRVEQLPELLGQVAAFRPDPISFH